MFICNLFILQYLPSSPVPPAEPSSPGCPLIPLGPVNPVCPVGPGGPGIAFPVGTLLKPISPITAYILKNN